MNNKTNTSDEIINLKKYILSRYNKEDFKTVSISSVSKGDSKADLAIELAQNLAADKYKILLIDLDLYTPAINRRLSLINECGITDYVGKISTKEDVITKINKYFDVILTGSEIKYPKNFLLSNILNNAIIELSKGYDLVIINNAPFKKIEDVEGPSNYADAVILCVSQNSDSKKDLKKVKKFIDEVSLNLMGIVVTNAKEKVVAKKQPKKEMRNVVFNNKIKFTTKETIRSKQYEKLSSNEDEEIEPKVKLSRKETKVIEKKPVRKTTVKKKNKVTKKKQKPVKKNKPVVKKKKAEVKKAKPANKAKTTKKVTKPIKKKVTKQVAKTKSAKKINKPTKQKKQVVKKKIVKKPKVKAKTTKTIMSQQDRIKAALANQKLKDRLKSRR